MIRKYVDEYASEANLQDSSYEAFLAHLLQKERDARRESARYNRIRRAAFSQKKYLEDVSVPDSPEDAQKKLKTLKSLDFIREGRNVIFSGNSGTGKTHLSIGLGMKACMEGFKIWYNTVPILVNQIKETRVENSLRYF